MFDAGRRPMGRLFYLLVATMMTGGILASTSAAGAGGAPAPQSGPALTSVVDTVYRADGTPAQGILVISWPAFITASGTPVAAGTTNVTLGTNGALNVGLVPNAGSSPAGVYYVVVYQLGPGEVRTEFWLVPTTSPANLAAVRTTPGSGIAGQPVSLQYVNTELATKANDNSVVHLSGSETITGTKTFSAAPSVPAPTATGQAANKGYVDTSVANVGSGVYLPTAGGAMTGPITLPANPVSAMQAANKQYVDTGLAVKADLISGLVPATELGAGTANSGTCLYGNGTWGPCGSGSGNVSTTPAGTQAIAEPSGAVFTANRIGQKRMADQFNWRQSPTSPSALAAGANTVTLSPCPAGFLNTINGSNSNHWIYVDSASGDAQQPGEPVLITAESCPAGANSGTITFSTGYAHGAGYALESGTGGIKEASVDANQVRYDTVRGNNTWIEVTPVATIKMKAPLYWQTTMGKLTGSSLVECSLNMSCINIGDTNSQGFGRGSANTYTVNVVDGLWLRPDQTMALWDVAPSAPAAITSGATSATLTIATCPSGFWPLIPNQILWLNGTSGGLVSTAYEAGAPGPGEFVRVTGGTCTPGATNGTITIVPATPGITALYAHDAGYTLSNGANALIEDNAQSTVISNIQTNGWIATAGYGFVIQNDNDQAEQVTNVNMNGGIRCDNDFCGATLFGPGPNNINAGITFFSGGSNGACAEWYDGNDLSIGPTICQGFQNYSIFMSTKRGGSLQRANIHYVHRERGGVSNSLGQNLGAADMIVQGYNVTVDGNGPGINGFPAFPVAGNPGGQLQVYYLAIVDVTDGTKTVPIPIGQASVTNPATNNVTVKWVTADGLAGKTINFELYRLSPTSGVAGVVPYPGVCDGVNGDGSCLLAGSLNPASVCDIHGACMFTDNVQTPAAVTPYSGIDGTGTGGYFPTNSFSPGGIVLTSSATYQGEPACLVAASGPWLNTFASVFDNAVPPSNCIPSGGSFNTVLTAFSNNAGGYSQFGLLLPDRNKFSDGGNWWGLKGRLNFVGGGTYPRDIATWRDSNAAKTMASKLEYGSGVTGTTYGTVNRPQWDAADIATGVENNGTGLYERVPTSGVFDWYLGTLPNNPGGTSNNWAMELAGSGLNVKVPVSIAGNLTVTSGTVALPITGSASQCLHVSSTGVLSGTGADCGAGSGSGTVNSGTAAELAVYAGTGAAVSGDSALTDNGTTLNYSGSGGVAAATGTFSGNVTVNGQLLVAGPWMVSSPIPGTAMPPAGAGTSALGISNDGNFYISANGGTPLKVTTTATSSFFSSLFQEDANDVGAYNGTNPQGVNVYGTRTDASNYERLHVGYDATNNYFTMMADYAGTGQHRGLGFNVNGSLRWVIDTLNTFKPWSDNVQDIGSSSLRVHNGYFGTGVVTPNLTLNGTALSSVIGTPSSALITAGTVSGSGQPLCTDGSGNLTITTVGCPPGTGTLGGSGTTPQFAYWTNTAGLGAAPLYLSSANTVEQYNGTNVQTLNVYGTRTDASNYERAGLAYVSADGYYELQAQQAGTGSQRGICFGVNNSCKWAVDTTTAFKPFNDNSRDIGTSSLRVRDFYLGRNLIMSGTATTYNGKTTAGTGLAPVYGAIAPTGQTAAIASSTLCASATCGAGQFEVTYYLDSTVACTTAGSASASLTIGWTDETNAKTLQVPLSGTGISGGNSVTLGSTANFGSGTIALWSAGTANITYSTSYAGCTTGTGTYALRVAVRQLQ